MIEARHADKVIFGRSGSPSRDPTLSSQQARGPEAETPLRQKCSLIEHGTRHD
jgi:hypothetical protein